MNAVFSGLGGTTFAYEEPNNLLAAHLRQNIHAFSAAKSLTEMQKYNELLIGPDGKARSEAQYINECAKAGLVFNKTYLAADRQYALASTQTAQTWNEFADSDYVQISTSGGENVCPICGGFQGFTRLKTDKAWGRICPPFHPNCNCKLIPGARHAVKSDNGYALLKQGNVQRQFQSNPGLEKVIYNNDWPYFQAIPGGKLQNLKWDKTYHMRPLERTYQDAHPVAEPAMTKDEANAWWRENAGSKKGSFEVKDKLGTVIRFDNNFRNHAFEQNKDNRFEYIANAEAIVKDPDEIWSLKDKGGNLKTTYIKYYDDCPYNVQVDGTQAFTIYKYQVGGKINEQSLNDDRCGVLLFRKH